MRAIRIDPFQKQVTRHYLEPDTTGIINHYVQSSELVVVNLGTMHQFWFDAKWFRRIGQEFFCFTANPQTLFGGYALITGGRDREIENCSLPVDGVEAQFSWVGAQVAENMSILKSLRRGPTEMIPRENVVSTVGRA